MKYLLLVNSGAASPDASADDGMAAQAALIAELRASGRLVDCSLLAEPTTATTVRMRDGAPLTAGTGAADGSSPTSYYLVECATHDEAMQIAARLSAARTNDVVVRALKPLPGFDDATAVRLPIETERLTLRAFAETDLDALHDLHSRDDVARYMYWEPWSRARALEALGRRMRATTISREGDSLALAVVRRDSGRLIGDIHVEWVSAEHRRGEIGFSFHPDAQGQGFAREAAHELLRLGFETFGLRRIIGRCDAANRASAALMQRLGMRRETHLVENELVKGVWASEEDYAMLADEWWRRSAQPGVVDQ